MTTGYIVALVCSVFFSLLGVSKKLSKASPLTYTLFVGLGFALASLIYYVVSGLIAGEFDNLLHPAAIFPMLIGVGWAVGGLSFVTAIDRIGLSRSNQWKNLQGPIGVFLCLIVLGEWAQIRVGFVLLAVVAIVISAYLFTIKGSDGKRVDRKGIWLAIASAAMFGTSAMLQKAAINEGLGGQAQQLYAAVCYLLLAAGFVLYKSRSLKVIAKFHLRDNLFGLLGGVLTWLATVTMITANNLLPASIAYTIMQFNAVWTILIGVLIFKEINWRKHWLRLLVGIILAIVSIGLLVLGRPG